MQYGYTMVDASTAVCPLLGVDHTWTCTGLEGNTAVFEKGPHEKHLTLPFHDGGTCTALRQKVSPVDKGVAPVEFWQMYPDRTGSKTLKVSVGLDGDTWFAVANLVPLNSLNA